jgi:D-lyxose ketol-isomerase
MKSNHDGCPRRRFLTGMLATGTCAAVLAPLGAAAEKGEKSMNPIKNEDFYQGGKFLADKAKDAYFSMMRRFSYPIPPRLQKELWAVDFSLGDFARVGMAGIFWYNDKATNVFGHEIFLLPGQMIVEHGHEITPDAQAKREAWHVRHGWICTFGEGAAPEGTCPVELPRSQTKFITAHNWKQVKEGEVDSLGRATARHFMIAGPSGAIVTEYGTYHDGAGLRFTNPGVKF